MARRKGIKPPGALADMAGFDFAAGPAPEAIAPPRSSKPKPKPKPAPDAPTPHYHGHRDRLRARFFDVGPEALADYELLELILFRAIPRRDTKPIAKALIARFGDLSAVLAAPPARLAEVEGVGLGVAQDLAVLQALLTRCAGMEARKRTIVTNWSQLLSYCRLALQHETREQFRVLFLDRKNQIIRDEAMSEGTVDQAPAFPREILRRALELGASALILVHNHPSGDPQPSREDVAITREIAAAAQALSIAVHDHLVVGRNGVASFKSLGLM